MLLYVATAAAALCAFFAHSIGHKLIKLANNLDDFQISQCSFPPFEPFTKLPWPTLAKLSLFDSAAAQQKGQSFTVHFDAI